MEAARPPTEESDGKIPPSLCLTSIPCWGFSLVRASKGLPSIRAYPIKQQEKHQGDEVGRLEMALYLANFLDLLYSSSKNFFFRFLGVFYEMLGINCTG